MESLTTAENPMFSSIQNLFRASRPMPRASARRRKLSLQVELLEERDVPTVVFMPQFGPETINGSLNDGMQDPGISLVFSGNHWKTIQGQQDEAGMVASVYGILNSGYLSGLKQYGSDGQAYMDPWAAVSDTVPVTNGQASTDDVQNFLNNAISNPANGLVKPSNDDWQHARIYVVISDPASSQGSGIGWNRQGSYEVNFLSHHNMHMIWIPTSNNGGDTAVNRDQFTDTFSHELAETISDPDSNGITIPRSSSLPKAVRGDSTGQIGDFEPDDDRYQYRVGRTQDSPGVLVQAYWSNSDQAFIVPDGNLQKVVLTPNWNGSTFNGNFRLAVTGGQLGANVSDQITLDDVDGGVELTLNREVFQFDRTLIAAAVGEGPAINIETVVGADHVQINGVPSVNAVPGTVGLVQVLDTHGTDAVTIGNGSLAGISSQTAINVNNVGGPASVFVSGYLGGGANVTIDAGAILYDGIRINYQLPGSPPANVEVDAGNGSLVDAESLWYHETITVDVGPSDVVTGPAANQITVHRRSPIVYSPIVWSVGTGTTATVGHAFVTMRSASNPGHLVRQPRGRRGKGTPLKKLVSQILRAV
jgi:hypothetical protein